MSDRYYYDSNGNYKGHSSRNGPGCGILGACMFLTIIIYGICNDLLLSLVITAVIVGLGSRNKGE